MAQYSIITRKVFGDEEMLPRIDLIRAEENSWLLMNNKDHISDFIKKNGFWGQTEATIAKVFLANRQNTNTLDVGANLGGFTLPIAKYVSQWNGAVFAFEPQRIVFQQLCANIFINSLDNVHTFNIALGDQICDLKIPELDLWKSQNIGGFSIDKEIRDRISVEASEGKTFPNKESESVFSVAQKTLDSLSIEFEINLLKVDVEGFELEFFTGALETIEKNNFPPIIFEVWNEKIWYKKKAERTKNILAKLGYEFFEFGREILAQHPSHAIQCIIERDGGNVSLKIEDKSP